MLSSIAASLLLAMPVWAVPKVSNFGAMEIFPRANYLGGWSQGRDGTGGGCPTSSTACDAGTYNNQLNTQCCPNGQTCFASSIIAYCCPSSSDCKTSVTNFPVCAGPGLTMYYSPGGYFCCEANEKGTIRGENSVTFDGLCVPADQPVASSMLAETQTQIGSLPSATGASGSVISSVSAIISSTSSRTNPAASAGLTSASSVGSSGDSDTTSTTTRGPLATNQANTGDSTSSTEKSGSNSSKLGVGAIVGIAIGGVAILLLVAILFFLIKRSRAKKHQQTANTTQDYDQPPMGAYPGRSEVSGVGITPGIGRKAVASTTINPAYNTPARAGHVSPISTTPSPGPPGYANLANQPQGQHVPPPPSSTAYSPHSNYAEIDSTGYPVNRVELRGE